MAGQLELMRTWISQCENNHPKCKALRPKTLPARLLSVRPFADSDDVKLVGSNATQGLSKYVILSHCWGPASKHPLTTTKASLDDRKRRIKFDDLSLTFQDAVRLCRDLDQQYLWIDSLCIYPRQSRFACRRCWRQVPPKTAVFIATFSLGIGE
jgi:hypothetical protein